MIVEYIPLKEGELCWFLVPAGQLAGTGQSIPSRYYPGVVLSYDEDNEQYRLQAPSGAVVYSLRERVFRRKPEQQGPEYCGPDEI